MLCSLILHSSLPCHGPAMPLLQRFQNALTRLPSLLPTLAALLACWWLVASVTVLLAPAAPVWRVLATPQPQAAAGSVAQQAWFGSSQVADTQAAPPLQVLGVLGGGGQSRQDFAIVLENGQSRPLRVGEHSPGGWWLRKVEGDGIMVQRQGGPEVKVALQRQGAAAPAPAQPGQVMVPSAPPALITGQPVPQPMQAMPGESSVAVPPVREVQPGSP